MSGADELVDGVRCWQCGAEPLTVVEVTSLSDPRPRYMPGYWPTGDHAHEAEPPSPSELLDRGDRAVARIMAIAAE